MTPRRLTVWLALALVLIVGRAASAPSAAEARDHFKRGTALYDDTDYRGALAEFKRAYEILPNAIVLFNIAQSHYQLNEYVAALQTFQKYLEDKDPTGATRRALALKEVEELKLRVTTVQVQTNVKGAEISIDDQVIGPSPQTTLVAVGRRKFSATLAGHRPAVRTVDLASGSTPPIVLELIADAPVAPPAPAASSPVDPRPTPPPSSSPGPLVYGSFGVGAAGLIVGSIFGLVAMNNRSSLDEKCAVKAACPDDARPEKDALERNGAISTIGFAVAVIGGATGLVLFLTGRGSTPRPATGLVVGPLGLGTKF